MGPRGDHQQQRNLRQAAQEEAHSAVPGIGYPVPLAITTVALSVVAYFFALFA